MTRVLLAPVGSWGDVRPMLALGRALAASGHAVSLAAPPDFEAEAGRLGFAFHAVGRSAEAFLHNESAAVVARPIERLKVTSRYLVEELSVQFEGLARAAKGAELVVGASLQFAARSVAEALGLPCRFVVFCPQALRSASHPPVIVPWQSMPGSANLFLWRASDLFYDRLLTKALNRCRADLGLASVRRYTGHMNAVPMIVASDEALAPVPDDVRPRPVQSSAWHLDDDEALSPDLEAFLAVGEAPLYMGFGSMTDPEPERTTAILAEASRISGTRMVLARGWAGLGRDPLPDEILAIDRAPHATLFPRVAAAVHHGGAGTTAAAARAGIPQLIVPHLLDQFFWGARIYRLGLGPRPIPRSKLTVERLAGAFAALRSDPEYAQRARIMGETIRGADRLAETASRLTSGTLRP
ncbi:MAG: glycosyltransferase [Deltaproteobacteria bacterium]|nr:glycosyltransferase [Deltaproteobacteria bacterium]